MIPLNFFHHYYYVTEKHPELWWCGNQYYSNMIIDDWWIINSFSFQINVCVCVCEFEWLQMIDWFLKKNKTFFFSFLVNWELVCFVSLRFLAWLIVPSYPSNFGYQSIDLWRGKLEKTNKQQKKNIQPDQLIMIKWLSLRLMIFQKMLGQIYDDKWNFLFFHLLCPSDSYPY